MTIDIGLDPILARIGPFQIGWHGLFTALAVLVAVWFALRTTARAGLPLDAVSEVVLWAFVGGVIGARLFHVADHLDYYLARPLEILAVWQGGIAVYGSMLGGIAAGLIAATRLGLPRWRLLDVAAPSMLIGMAIGRLGCLSNGDAWGAPCAWGLCLRYTHPDAQLPATRLNVPTYPYPLYEIAAELVLLGVLWTLRHRSLTPGVRFLIVALGYAAIRFGLTFLREEPILALGLQEAQLVALATAAAALVALAGRLRSARREPTAGVAGETAARTLERG